MMYWLVCVPGVQRTPTKPCREPVAEVVVGVAATTDEVAFAEVEGGLEIGVDEEHPAARVIANSETAGRHDRLRRLRWALVA